MTQHPLSAAFPPLPDAEFVRLVDSIRQHGQRHPVVTLDGMVLDGWHRYRACTELCIEARQERFMGTDPREFVLDGNLTRRHMDAGQRAVAVARVHEWRGAGNIAPGATLGNEDMAKLAGVSKRTIIYAKDAIVKGKDKAVINGEMSLKAAVAPKPAPAASKPPAESDEEPDITRALEDSQAQIQHQQGIIDSLTKSDREEELVQQITKFQQLNAHCSTISESAAELKRQVTYMKGLLSEIREALGVTKNAHILEAIKKLNQNESR